MEIFSPGMKDCWLHFSLEPPRAESLLLAYCSFPKFMSTFDSSCLVDMEAFIKRKQRRDSLSHLCEWIQARRIEQLAYVADVQGTNLLVAGICSQSCQILLSCCLSAAQAVSINDIPVGHGHMGSVRRRDSMSVKPALLIHSLRRRAARGSF